MDYDAGDDETVKKRKTKSQIRRDQELEDIKNLLKFPGNRAFLWRIMEEGGILKSISSVNVGALQLAAGRQDLALAIKDELEAADPLSFINMYREAQQRDKL